MAFLNLLVLGGEEILAIKEIKMNQDNFEKNLI